MDTINMDNNYVRHDVSDTKAIYCEEVPSFQESVPLSEPSGLHYQGETIFKASKLRIISDFIEVKVPQKAADPSFGKFMEGCMLILKTMIIEDLLPPDQIINHLDYLIDVSQTLQKCHLQHVLNCDAAYRREQFELGFAWGKISEELKSTYLFDFTDVTESKDEQDLSSSLDTAAKQDLSDEPVHLKGQNIKREIEDLNINIGSQDGNLEQDNISESSDQIEHSQTTQLDDTGSDTDCYEPSDTSGKAKEQPNTSNVKQKSVKRTNVKKSKNKEQSVNKEPKKRKKYDRGKQEHPCDICGKMYYIKSQLNLHLRGHSGIKPHKCTTCEKCFLTRAELTSHIRRHSDEKPYRCEACGKGFKRLGNLHDHRQIHTGKKYHCPICNKGLLNTAGLEVHMRSHTGETPYVCDICAKGFRDGGHLKTHMLIHSGEKPHKCDICNKPFLRKDQMERHRLCHAGNSEKKCICDVCGYSCHHEFQLVVHKRTHTGERPYKCRYCEDAFTMSSARRRHERIHTGEKPYKCQVCEKAFKDPSTLKKHQYVHNKEKPFACEICSKRFPFSHVLKKHMATHVLQNIG